MLLLYFLAAVVFLNCAYYFIFSKFAFSSSTNADASDYAPVSLIVCAKNEAANLQKHIPLWLEQQYPTYELILINDASTDNTLEVMEQFAEQDSRIKIVNVENNEAFWASKKYALTLGIKRAANNQLVFTDADCRPASSLWLSHMAAHFTEEKEVILGYGGYEKQPGLLNQLIRFETVHTAMQYFGYAAAGMPYMGVGRNLAYTSRVYYENNGFISHIKLPSGDDDLLVNETATASNTSLCIEPEAFTYSIPKQTFKAWIRQKRRHISTASRYKSKHKLLLGVYFLSNLSFWLLAIAALVFSDWRIALVLIGLRILMQYIVVGKSAKKLKEETLIPFLPIYELFLVCLQLSIFISKSTSKNSRWK